MKTAPRVILIAALLVLSVVVVLPVSAGHSSSSALFQSPVDTPTLPPPATNTPIPPATDTPVPAATSTPAPAATNTPMPAATNTPGPVATSTPYATYVPPTYPPPPPPVYQIIAYWTVQPGQTLYCIGRYYSVSPWAISSVNYIPWPYYIYPGQVLAIPNAPWYNIPPGPVCYPGVPNVTPTPLPGADTAAAANLSLQSLRAVGTDTVRHRVVLRHDDSGDHVRQSQHHQSELDLRRIDFVHPVS
jgi:LysM repeat protein